MDGRVLEELFTKEYLSQNPVRASGDEAYAQADGSAAMTDEESEEIRQRLRGLGYLG